MSLGALEWGFSLMLQTALISGTTRQRRIVTVPLEGTSRGRGSHFFTVEGGGVCGGLFFWSSLHNPQGNGLPCLGHLVALIAFHLGGVAAREPHLVCILLDFD